MKRMPQTSFPACAAFTTKNRARGYSHSTITSVSAQLRWWWLPRQTVLSQWCGSAVSVALLCYDRQAHTQKMCLYRLSGSFATTHPSEASRAVLSGSVARLYRLHPAAAPSSRQPSESTRQAGRRLRAALRRHCLFTITRAHLCLLSGSLNLELYRSPRKSILRKNIRPYRNSAHAVSCHTFSRPHRRLVVLHPQGRDAGKVDPADITQDNRTFCACATCVAYGMKLRVVDEEDAPRPRIAIRSLGAHELRPSRRCYERVMQAQAHVELTCVHLGLCARP